MFFQDEGNSGSGVLTSLQDGGLGTSAVTIGGTTAGMGSTGTGLPGGLAGATALSTGGSIGNLPPFPRDGEITPPFTNPNRASFL